MIVDYSKINEDRYTKIFENYWQVDLYKKKWNKKKKKPGKARYYLFNIEKTLNQKKQAFFKVYIIHFFDAEDDIEIETDIFGYILGEIFS